MRISSKGLYALRFMVFLASRDVLTSVPLKDISDATGISRKYLEQIASMLATAKLVRSTRGAAGGYRLARSADAITLFDVLTVTEGSLAPVECLNAAPGEASPGESPYEIFIWRGLYDQIKGYLQGITLQEVVDRSIALSIDSYSI